MKKLLIILSAGFFVSCGPAWHLKKANQHIQKAKDKGATITSDTTKVKVAFNVPGAKTTFDLGPIVVNRRDGTQFVPVLKDTVIYKDRIKTIIKDNTVAVECPDEVKVVEVPVEVKHNISSGYTTWQVIRYVLGGALFALVVGFLLSKIIKL